MVSIAVIGASGLVGEAFLSVLATKMPTCRLRLFGEKSAGKTVNFCGRSIKIQRVDELPTLNGGYAIFAADNAVSQRWIPVCQSNGVTCIDNSSAFRLDDGVPLVVPPVNADVVDERQTLFANPNCTTIQVCVAVNPLKPLLPQKMKVVTMQAASGAGMGGLLDLTEGRSYGRLKEFAHPIVDNVLPKIGLGENGKYTTEELKMKFESRKILNLPSLAVNCLCNRVPVSRGHSVWVNLTLGKPFSIGEVKDLLKQQPQLLLLDNAESDLYPMPQILRYTSYVGVGRIVADETDERTLNMFVVADNLLRGAAYNAYEILQLLICKRGKTQSTGEKNV